MFICVQPYKSRKYVEKEEYVPVMMSLSVIYVKILHVVTSCQKKKILLISYFVYQYGGQESDIYDLCTGIQSCVLESIPVCVLFCSPGPIVHVSFSDLLSSVVHVGLYFFCSLFHRRDGVNFSLTWYNSHWITLVEGKILISFFRIEKRVN